MCYCDIVRLYQCIISCDYVCLWCGVWGQCLEEVGGDGGGGEVEEGGRGGGSGGRLTVFLSSSKPHQCELSTEYILHHYHEMITDNETLQPSTHVCM